MRVIQAYGIEAAAGAEGHVVVIDVVRAFTTAAFAFEAGAREIALVGTPEEAFALRGEWRDAVLVGESGGRPIPGFDFGNGPAALVGADLRGHRVILRSSSGTQGVVRATAAKEILLGSLVVARATSRDDTTRATLAAILDDQFILARAVVDLDPLDHAARRQLAGLVGK